MDYKLLKDKETGLTYGALRSDGWSFIFDPANTDYANFKKEILADEAQLQDADGVLMTAEQAKAYVASLP